MACLWSPHLADVLFKKAKGCSGAPCTHQRSLRCILAQCPISARTTQICLLSQVDFQLPGHHSLRHADLADYLFDGVSHQHATQDLTSCVALHHPAPREAIGDWILPAKVTLNEKRASKTALAQRAMCPCAKVCPKPFMRLCWTPRSACDRYARPASVITAFTS